MSIVTGSSELQQKIHTIDSIWKRVDRKRKQDWKDDAEIRYKEFQSNRKQIIKDLETEYLVSEGTEDSFTNCPECYEDTLIVYGEYEGICSNPDCNNISPVRECNRCSALMPGFSSDFEFCDYCTEWINEQ